VNYKKKREYKNFFVFILFVLCTGAALTVFYYVYNNAYGNVLNAVRELQAAPVAYANELPPPVPAISTVPVNINDLTDTGYLHLVNREHAAQAPPYGKIDSAWPTVPVRTTEIFLHNTALEAVASFMYDARQAQVEGLYLSSGYRSFAEQEALYNADATRSYAMPPNHSEHHTGLAADILIMGIPQFGMEDTPEGRWMASNAYKHGLILRYPAHGLDITGVPFEPWHFRYIGQPHAHYCHVNGLTLEEYIAFLWKYGGYTAELYGVTYTVSYQTPVNNHIQVPEALLYEVSGDNTGGYIITAWE
jgi:D-alanyl-D-alanine carboxypeptidase